MMDSFPGLSFGASLNRTWSVVLSKLKTKGSMIQRPFGTFMIFVLGVSQHVVI